MRKFLITALAVVTLSGTVLATATPAAADGHRSYYGHRHHRSSSDKTAIAVAAGIAGLALGAVLSSKSTARSGYSSGAYRDTPHRNGYEYDSRDDSYGGDYDGRGDDDAYESYVRPRVPAICTTTERVYDRFSGRRVTVERRYAC